MKFKDKLIKEYWKRVDERIRIILSYIDLYTQLKFKKEVVITELIRLRTIQISIYKNLSEYKNVSESNIPHSVHEYGRGADFRTSNFEEEEIEDIMETLNKLPYGDDKHKTALRHNIGTGDHIHVQVKNRG
jgi:hypothetical protein